MSVPIESIFDKHMTPGERRAAKARAETLIAEYATLREVRHAQQLTQVRLAEMLGVNQKNVSELERRTDVMISTLRGYIEAMGGSLDLVVRFPDQAPLVLQGLSSANDDPDEGDRP